MAKRMEEKYIKSANEDFNSIMKGALGNKGRIHVKAGNIMEEGMFASIEEQESSLNDQLKILPWLLIKKFIRTINCGLPII